MRFSRVFPIGRLARRHVVRQRIDSAARLVLVRALPEQRDYGGPLARKRESLPAEDLKARRADGEIPVTVASLQMHRSTA